jgi:hypothetical protein
MMPIKVTRRSDGHAASRIEKTAKAVAEAAKFDRPHDRETAVRELT